MHFARKQHLNERSSYFQTLTKFLKFPSKQAIPMNIIEHFLCGKRPDPSLCEDGWVVTPHFAAVVDGSTSKVPGRHGGREAMLAVTEALRHLNAQADKKEMLSVLTACLAERNIPEATAHAEYRLTCSAVIYSAFRRTVWMVGDCQARWNGRTFTNPKLVDSILTDARCGAVRHLLAHGHTEEDIRRHDLGRAAILDALREQTNFQNDPNDRNPYRYAVLDGTPVPEALVKELSVEHAATLVLASDGYPVLADTLEESEAALQHLLLADPLCINENAATKCLVKGNNSFDDRCFLKIALP